MVRKLLFPISSSKLNSETEFVYAVNGEDLGSRIVSSGLLSSVKTKFFICNNATNNPLGNGLIILAHSPYFWRDHPTFIHVINSNINVGVVDCTDINNLKIIK